MFFNLFTEIHFHGLPHYNISTAYHITIICVFLQIPENVTLRDTFSYMHSMLSIDFIDASTSKSLFRKDSKPDHSMLVFNHRVPIRNLYLILEYVSSYYPPAFWIFCRPRKFIVSRGRDILAWEYKCPSSVFVVVQKSGDSVPSSDSCRSSLFLLFSLIF